MNEGFLETDFFEECKRIATQKRILILEKFSGKQTQFELACK